MELTLVLPPILEAAKAFATLVPKLLSHREDRRKATAVYFENIATTLADFSPKLHAGATDAELSEFCGKLQAFAEQLPHTVNHVVGREEIEELSRMLKQSHKIERWILLNDNPQKAHHLARLSEAAGYFRASAISLRAA
jgi:hypothetical protein